MTPRGKLMADLTNTPLPPPSGGEPASGSGFTLKVGDYGAQTTYRWDEGNPRRRIPDRLARAIIEEFTRKHLAALLPDVLHDAVHACIATGVDRASYPPNPFNP